MEFFASRSIEEVELVAWVTRVLGVSRVEINRLPNEGELWVESVLETGGEYPQRITLFSLSLSVSTQVARACDFAKAMGCEVLTSDERNNPFSWVQVTREGRARSVFVDVESLDRGEFVVVGPAVPLEGSVWAARPLDFVRLRTALSGALNVDERHLKIELQTLDSEPAAKGTTHRFGAFIHVHRDERPWFTLEQEARRWHGVVAQLAVTLGQSLIAGFEQGEHAPIADPS